MALATDPFDQNLPKNQLASPVNTALEALARSLHLNTPEQHRLRLRLGHACVQRVRRFIENPEVLVCLDTLGAYLDGAVDAGHLQAALERAAALANQHPGSRSLDGVGHAAVSATYAVAQALAGKALVAADYAAYAAVYGEGGYGAVADPQSFEPEHVWQLACLRGLADPFAQQKE